MTKILKIVLIILVIFSLAELGYLIFLSKSKTTDIPLVAKPSEYIHASVTPNSTPFASPVINLSVTPIITLIQNRTSPDDWNKILKMRSNTVVYEAILENIQVRTPTADDKVELSLVFNSQRHLVQTFGGRDMSILKVYTQSGDDLLAYDYRKLKPGDLIELSIAIADELEQEIIIIKKNQ